MWHVYRYLFSLPVLYRTAFFSLVVEGHFSSLVFEGDQQQTRRRVPKRLLLVRVLQISKMSNNKKNKVQISLYASNLKNTAGLGKGIADPYAVVTLLAGSADERPSILGRTEVVKNSLSPSWTTTFAAEYAFGQECKINIGLFDEIRKTQSSKSMGSAQFEIGEILGSKGNIKAKKLRSGGTLFVRVTKASNLDLGNISIGLRGIKLKNVDGVFSKSDPFFVVESYTKDNHGGRVWQPVYRSEVVKNNLNPMWQDCEIPLQKLCGGDKEQPLQISVYDWEKV
jgi:Ca2+-dependent lipid-binding protein